VSDDRPSRAFTMPLAIETGYLYCGAEHEAFSIADSQLNNERLSNYALVQHGYSSAESRMIAELGLKSAATSHQTEGVLFMVLAGTHIGFLPDHYAAAWEARGMIRRMRPKEIVKKTKTAFKANRASLANPMVSSFLSIAKSRKKNSAPD
jgi:LysR family transcriptional regulator, transcriptional activator for bauABCD operon